MRSLLTLLPTMRATTLVDFILVFLSVAPFVFVPSGFTGPFFHEEPEFGVDSLIAHVLRMGLQPFDE